MTTNRTQEVLYESEAALRLVDHELSSLHEGHHSAAIGPDGLGDIAGLLDRANTQILSVLARLREGRAAIEQTAMGKVRMTQDKLREVSTATEDAAINILDACDRATGLVDELDTIDAEPASDSAKSATLRASMRASLRASLRDELFLMMGALQFQDITAQQLAHAAAVLDEMEQRIMEVARLFDPSIALNAPQGGDVNANVAAELAYDVNATTRDADSRQALADEIFTAVKGHAA